MWPSHKLFVCPSQVLFVLFGASAVYHPPFAIHHSTFTMAIAASTSMRQFDTPQGDGCIQSDMTKTQDIQDIQYKHRLSFCPTFNNVCLLHRKIVVFSLFHFIFCLVTFLRNVSRLFSLFQLTGKRKQQQDAKSEKQRKFESWK